MELRAADRKRLISIIHYSYPSISSWLDSKLHIGLRFMHPLMRLILGSERAAKLSMYMAAPFKTPALTADISAGGMGIITTEPLKSGQQIFIFRRGIGHSPTNVTVRWCMKDTGGFYRIGLAYC